MTCIGLYRRLRSSEYADISLFSVITAVNGLTENHLFQRHQSVDIVFLAYAGYGT